MKLVCTSKQVRAQDQQLIGDVGVPGACLMELASQAVAAGIVRHHEQEARSGVVVVCGAGNNGGDGYGCARWLVGWGYPVTLLELSDTLQGDAELMAQACRALKIPTTTMLGPCGLIVDAVFGTGLTRAVSGPIQEVLRAMNGHAAPVVAVDVPSGLCADTGRHRGTVVSCVRTITLGYLKPGLLTESGAEVAGEVEVADIGLGVVGGEACAEIPETQDLAPLWPVRHAGSHKRSSGHLLVVAGSTAMSGAAVLACLGALSSGVGLVTLCAPRGALPRLASLPPEVMLLICGEGDFIDPSEATALDRYTAVLAGPGLGGGRELLGVTVDWLANLWLSAGVPALFDADALPVTKGDPKAPRVITPHVGEAARLLGKTTTELQSDRFGTASALTREKVTAVLKGQFTLVAHAGERISVNTTGNSVLATAGSGDVLSGVIGGLLARGLDGRDAARLGVWVHGQTANLLRDRGREGWTARDVALTIPEAVELLLEDVFEL